MPETRVAQQRHHIEQGVLSIRSVLQVSANDALVGISERLERKLQDILRTWPPGGAPDALKDGDQIVDRFITITAQRGIQRIDARGVRQIGTIDQHHIILPRGWHESDQRLDQFAMGLHHEEVMWSGVVGQNGRCEMQKERTFALTGTGDGQQIVAEHVGGERDRQGMPRMGRTADPPASTARQFLWRKVRACTSPFQEWKIGEIAGLWQMPEHRHIGHAQDMA